MVQQVGHDSFKLEASELEWYDRYLADVPGVTEHRRQGKLVDVLIHRSHLSLLPSEMIPAIVSPRSASWSVSPPQPLRDYQIEAVEFARSRGGAAFFHDLGLGKNYSIFPALDYPALACCPTSALQVWEEEAKGYGLDVQVHQGRDASLSKISYDADLHLVTYGSVSYWLPLFHGRGKYPRVRSVAMDEAHALHKQASRVHAALASVKQDSTIVMTATPARNCLRSLHGLLHAIAPGAFGSLTEFRVRYAGADLDAWGHLSDGEELTNVEELASRLTEVAIAETWLSDRVRHLRPPLKRIPIEAELGFDERVRMIEEAISRAYGKLKTAGAPSAPHISYMTAQRIELGKLKAEWFLRSALLEDLLSKHKRQIVWCWHKEVLASVEAGLRSRWEGSIDIVTGEAPTGRRRQIVKEWRHGDPEEPRILLATLGAMSTAVNLTTAEAATFLELSWAPLDLQQAEARHHRPGSKFDEVYAYYISVPGMIDGHMTNTLLEKVEHMEQALGECSQKDQMLSLLEGQGRGHPL